MRKRPLSLTLIGLLHFIYPVAYLAQFFIYSGVPLSRFFEAVFWLYNPFRNPHFFFISVSAIMVGYGLFKVRLWAIYLFWICAIYHIGHASYFMFLNSGPPPVIPHYIRIMTMIVSFGLIGFFAQKHILAPYFNPRIRWWERAPRYIVNFEAKICPDLPIEQLEASQLEAGRVLDMSVGGLYFATHRVHLIGEKLLCRFELLGQSLAPMAEIVWVNTMSTTIAPGIGMKFLTLKREDHQTISKYLKLARTEGNSEKA